MNIKKSHCLVVTCLPCNTPFLDKESPYGCAECGMMEWLCFDTEKEANDAFKKQYPELFNNNGEYIGLTNNKNMEKSNIESDYTGYEIGSYNWLLAIISQHKHIGEFLMLIEDYDENNIRDFGKQIYESSKELIEHYKKIKL